MTVATDLLRRDEAALVEALEDARCKVRGHSVKCGFHGDKRASASIYRDERGIWRFKCHRCGVAGDVFDIQALVSGRPLAEILKEASGTSRPLRAEPSVAESREGLPLLSLDQLKTELGPCFQACYKYVGPGSQRVDLAVVRYRRGDGKAFIQLHEVEAGSGLFVKQAPPKPWPLYNRSRIQTVGAVVLVEGEGVVHSLHAVDIVATTCPGGAMKGQHADLRPLAGKHVILWPDHDSAGVDHMRDLIPRLEALEPPPTLSWVDPAVLGLEDKGDATDFLALHDGQSIDTKRRAVSDVLRGAVPLGASQDLAKHVDEIIDGTRQAIPWPWPMLTRLSRALLPGTLTIICGPAGCGKSFLLLEAAMFWHDRGIRLAVLELEDGRQFHLNRCLAQLAGNSSLLDDGWVREHGDDAREAVAMHADALDSFGQRVHEMSGVDLTLAKLATWIMERAAAGMRVIVVDPVTAADSTATPWMADRAFVFDCKTAAEKYGASVVLATHPKKGRRGAIGLDELSGGASYSRFSQTVLWLDSHWPPKTVTIETPMGPMGETINRTLRLSKVRNASGGGLRLGFGFDGMTLRFREYGIIQQKEKSVSSD